MQWRLAAYGNLETMSNCSSPVRRGEADTLLLDRRHWLRAALAATLLPALSLPARAGFNLFLNEFTATRDELQAELARRFPITRRPIIATPHSTRPCALSG